MIGVIKVIQVGLGPIGRESARAIRLKKSLKLVGAVDIHPSLKGVDLKKLIGGKPGIKISDDLRRVLKNRKPDIAVVTTTSSLASIRSIMDDLLRNGVSMITSAEELLEPYLRSPARAASLDPTPGSRSSTWASTSALSPAPSSARSSASPATAPPGSTGTTASAPPASA